MVLHEPFYITAGLNIGLKIGGATIELADTGFQIHLECGHVHEVEDYSPGACHSSQDMFADILSFLDIWVDANVWDFTEHKDLFGSDTALLSWALIWQHEISMICCRLEEEEDLIH